MLKISLIKWTAWFSQLDQQVKDSNGPYLSLSDQQFYITYQCQVNITNKSKGK